MFKIPAHTRILSFAFCAFLAINAQGQSKPCTDKKQLEVVTRSLEDKHPSSYFVLAKELWYSGCRDEAVFCFYLGTLRYRFHLLTNQDGDPSGDPALFASLRATIGEPLNLYAGTNVDNWISLLEKVLEWDRKEDNIFVSKTKHSADWQKARESIMQLANHLKTNKQEFIEKQKEAGIGRIGLIDGIYYDEQCPSMPKDWPQLQKSTLDSFVGCYENDSTGTIGRILFDSADGGMVDSFEITKNNSNEITITGIRKRKDPLVVVIGLKENGNGFCFERVSGKSSQNNETINLKKTIYIYKNTDGNLILYRTYEENGVTKSGIKTLRINSYWDRTVGCTKASTTTS